MLRQKILRNMAMRLPASPSSNKQQPFGSNVDDSDEAAKANQQPAGLHSYQTALCIVPVEEIWDTIQRARHITGDETLYTWPPSIRLFHPFVPPSQLSQAALDAASQVVEKYHMEPFQVVLDSFVIIPYYLLDTDNRLVTGPQQRNGGTDSNTIEEYAQSGLESTSYNDVQELIAREERKGREKLKMRQLRKKHNDTSVSYSDDDDQNKDQYLSPKRPGRPLKGLLEGDSHFTATMGDSTNPYFDGPCFLCLQPNPSSRKKLQKLRNALKKELFSNYNAFAASASTIVHVQTPPASLLEKRPKPPPFRPLITLGRFPTVSLANLALKKLSSFWKPLSFNVTDLHFVSQAESSDVPGVVDGMSYLLNEAHFLYQSKQQFECDALVSLIGEEPISNNEDDDHNLLFHLMEDMPEKGAVINLDDLFQAKKEEAKLEAREMMRNAHKPGVDSDFTTNCIGTEDEGGYDARTIEQLLDIIPEEEADWNKGATIVIGRTQFFLGQMREYVGMPASNPIDAKDRVLGQGVSGAARRKPVVHRTGDRWNSGDYGSKPSDSFV